MKKPSKQNGTNLTLSEVCEHLHLKNTTLREWLDVGVCGFSTVDLVVEKRLGKDTRCLSPVQFQMLGRFVRYHELFPDVLISNLAEWFQMLRDGDYEGLLTLLDQRREVLEESLEEVRREIDLLQEESKRAGRAK